MRVTGYLKLALTGRLSAEVLTSQAATGNILLTITCWWCKLKKGLKLVMGLK